MSGATVYCSALKRNVIVFGAPEWNGHTWIYDFGDSDMRCGEEYLSAPRKPLTEEVPLEQLLIDQLGSNHEMILRCYNRLREIADEDFLKEMRSEMVGIMALIEKTK